MEQTLPTPDDVPSMFETQTGWGGGGYTKSTKKETQRGKMIFVNFVFIAPRVRRPFRSSSGVWCRSRLFFFSCHAPLGSDEKLSICLFFLPLDVVRTPPKQTQATAVRKNKTNNALFCITWTTPNHDAPRSTSFPGSCRKTTQGERRRKSTQYI